MSFRGRSRNVTRAVSLRLAPAPWQRLFSVVADAFCVYDCTHYGTEVCLGAEVRMNLPFTGAIDCDIHPSVPSTEDLKPYLDEYWREMLMLRQLDRMDLMSYPPNTPLAGRADWRPKQGNPGSVFEVLREQALDHFGARFAICNCLHGAQAVHDENMALAFCRAVNDWVRQEWLDRDSRLRASIVVPLQNADFAAEEIERVAEDKRFVQVLLLSRADLPLGRRYYWPIYSSAIRHGLPIGIHAGSMARHAPTQSGYPSFFLEDYVAQSQAFAVQVASLVAEGVFSKFPELKVVLIESGVTWLPAMIWRFGKDWRGVRPEIPWVQETPGSIVRDHIRLTLQPFDGPPSPADLQRLWEHLGSEDILLFSTDYPHWQFDGDKVLPDGFPESTLKKLLVDNALATYPRLNEVLQ